MGAPNVSPWSTLEDRKLRKMYHAGERYTAMSRALPGRTRQACTYRAWRIGLTLIRPRREEIPTKERRPFTIKRRLRCRVEFNAEGHKLFTCPECREKNTRQSSQYDPL